MVDQTIPGIRSGEHTEGPWSAEVQHGPDGEQNYAWVKAADGELICVVKTRHARLIAAAPDLLAACRAFMPKGIAIGNGNVPDDLIIPLDVTMGELRAFEAAIAKASRTPSEVRHG